MEKTTMSRNKTPVKRIGRIDTLGDGRFQWTIDDFLSQDLAYDFNSPNFNFLDGSYNIMIKLFKTHGTLAFYLESPPRRVLVELRIVTGRRGFANTSSGETLELGLFFGTFTWLSHLSLSDILPEGRLILCCNLRSLDGEIASSKSERLPGTDKNAAENNPPEADNNEDESISNWKTVEKMQKDMKNLLVSGEECDVIIKVQGKEFPGHRIILRARSPVFKSMFSHDMVEKQSGVVVIDDCDPAAFPDFLNYVYTGSTKQISRENVFSLYTASDKYGVEELKEECAAFMRRNVSVGTFCDTVTLALRHTEKELIDSATEFFRANLTEIIKTAKWQIFLHENTTVGNELLIKALSNG